MKNDYPTKEIIVCDCFSTEHQLVFTYMYGDDDTDYDVMNIEVHLISYDSFWKRLVAGIKYIFGHKSRYGEWDNFIVKHEDYDKFISYFQKLKDDVATVQAKHIALAVEQQKEQWSILSGGQLTSTTPNDTATN